MILKNIFISCLVIGLLYLVYVYYNGGKVIGGNNSNTSQVATVDSVISSSKQINDTQTQAIGSSSVQQTNTVLDVSVVGEDMEQLINSGSSQNIKNILEKVQIGKKRPDKNDHFTVWNSSIHDDIITIDVSYGGGCKEHDFDLFWDGVMFDLVPSPASLYLVHDANGDTCEAGLSGSIKFDLSLLRDEYQEEYSGYLNEADIGINIYGYRDDIISTIWSLVFE